MFDTAKSLLRPFKKVLLGASVLIGLYIFTLAVSRLVVGSLFRGIESSRSTGLSALIAMPPYYSADGLLQTAGKNVVRAVSLALEAPQFDVAEFRVAQITHQVGGFLEELKVHRQSDSSPWLEAKLRLPVNSFDSALTTIRSLGAVKQETEASEDTNAEKDSLSTQLESKRNELARLNEIVRRRTGSLSDSVAVEENLSERRKEAYDLQKQLNSLNSRVEYAFVELQIVEQYLARLDFRTAIASSDLRNSLIEGLSYLVASLDVVLGFLFRYGLVTALWAAILYWPTCTLWRRYRRLHPVPSPSNA
jgi:Domain of unknown function (DUF4349)